MILLASVLLAIFVLPAPWNVVVVALGAAWEVGEAILWIRWSQRRRAKVGAEALIGKTARVVARLDPEGQVQIEGELWRARLAAAGPLEAGESVRILALDGLTLIVEPAG